MRIVLLRGVRSLIIRSHRGALMIMTYISYPKRRIIFARVIEENNSDHWPYYG